MNVLITCAGRRNYLVDYFKDALSHKDSVYTSNSDIYSPAFSISDNGFILPKLEEEKLYIDKLIRICKKYQIKLIVPTFDLELPLLAKNKKLLLKNNIYPLVSSKKVINICYDKYLTYKFLEVNNLNPIKTYISLKKLKIDLKSNLVFFPIIIKPRWGCGSLEIYQADNIRELLFLSKFCIKNLKKTYILNKSKHSIVYQAKIDGQEYGLDVLNDLNSTFYGCFIKKKISMRSGETDVAQTIFDKVLYKLGKNIASRLGHIANLDIDVIIKSGKPYVLELNPRFGGGYPFTHECGANLIKVIIAWLEKESIKDEWLNFKINKIYCKGISLFKVKKL